MSPDLVERMRRDLGRGLRRLREEAGLSLRQVGAAVGSGASALSDLELGRGSRPPDGQKVRRFVETCLAAGGRDRTAQQERAKRLLADHAALVAVLEKAGDEPDRPVLGPPPPAEVVRVRDARPRTLGVHPAIRVAGTVGDLPAYVRRDSDALLLRLLAAARDAGGFILLVGGSAAGKTRSAYEATLAVVPDWRLVQPGTGEDIAAFAAARTEPAVLWLDEIQNLFSSGGTTAIFRGLLHGGPPTIMIGTLWPQHYHTFTATPVPGEADPYQAERNLIRLADVIDVPAAFSAAEQALARSLAPSEPRIAAALESTDFPVTAVLAAGPDLVRRWRNPPDPYTEAVMNAAVDARRLGVRTPLAADFLCRAAEDYLPPASRATAADDWFESALAYCTEPVRGAAAMLAPIDDGIGRTVGFRVADFLLQHGHEARDHLVPPRSFWVAAQMYVTDFDDRARLAVDALARDLLHHAGGLAAAPAAGGQRSVLWVTASVVDRAGRREEAERWWRAAAANSHSEVPALQLAKRLDWQGRHEEAKPYWDTGISTMYSGVYEGALTAFELDAHHDDEALQLEAAHAGKMQPRAGLSERLAWQGRFAEAERWRVAYQESRSAPWPGPKLRAMQSAHELLLGALTRHRDDRWDVSRASDAVVAVKLLEETGEYDAAELAWLGLAADDGLATVAMRGLASLYVTRGRHDDAAEWLLRAAEHGDPTAMVELAELEQRRRRLDQAERWLRRAVLAADPEARWSLAMLLRRDLRAEEADRLHRFGIEADGSTAQDPAVTGR